MKFHWDRYGITKEKREWSNRRIACAKRAIQREKDKTPMFPELAPDQTLDDRIKRMDQREVNFTNRMRNHRARTWRKARAFLRSLPGPDREKLLAKWNTKFMPGDPANLFATARMMGIYGTHNEENPDYAINNNESSLNKTAMGLAHSSKAA